MVSRGIIFLIIFCVSALAYPKKQFPRPNLCINTTTGETGLCMVTWLCYNVANGVHIGYCMDRFSVQSCCKIFEAGRFGKPTSNCTNETSETSKENFPQVEPLDEIINATSIGPLNRKPAFSDIRIINTSSNGVFLNNQQSNQQNGPETEEILEQYIAHILSYYDQLYRFRFNLTQNEGDKKSYHNSETPIQKISYNDPEEETIFYHQDNVNNSQYEINNHKQQPNKQNFGTDGEQSELEKITSFLRNAIKYNKNNTNAKPVTLLMQHKHNDDSSVPSSTISPSNSIKNESEPLYKVNISATSYSLSNEDKTLPESYTSTSNVSLNSSIFSDLHFSVLSSKPTVFQPFSINYKTPMLQDEVITPSSVYVLKDSSSPSMNIFPSSSVNATESLKEINVSKTLYSSIHSDIDREKLELESITSWLENFVKNNHKNITNAMSLMPQKHNDGNNKTISTISSPDSIPNEPDSQYEVSIPHTLYTSLKESTVLDHTPESTPIFSPNFTNFPDPHFSVTSSKATIFEPFTKPSETGFLQDEVITPSSVYVLKDSSEPSMNIFPSSSINATESLKEINVSKTLYSSIHSNIDREKLELENITSWLENFVKNNHKNIINAMSLMPQKHNEGNNKTISTISPPDSIPNEPDSQYEVSIPHTLYTSLKESTVLDHTPESTPIFSPNFTNFPDPHFSVTSSKATIFEPFTKPSETGFLQDEVITPSSVYVLKDSSEPSMNIFPSSSINATESLKEINVSKTLYSSIHSDTEGEKSKLENIASSLANFVKYNHKNITNSISLMPQKHNDNNNKTISTLSPPDSIQNGPDSQYEVSISHTLSTSLKESTPLDDTPESTSIFSPNFTNFMDPHLSVTSSEATIFEPFSKPSETGYLQGEVITPSPVYVLKDSSSSSVNIFPSSSINATESLKEINVSKTLYSSIHSDTEGEKSKLENIASSLANFVKYNHKNITNSISLMPQKHNDNNNKTVSTISPSDSIKNGPDSQYEVSTSHTLYTSLKEITVLDDTPESTTNFSPNFTNFPDTHFPVTSSKPTIFEPFSKPSETGFLQGEVITPSPVYVLKDSSEPSMNIFPSSSINATESLKERNVSKTLYSSIHSDTDREKSKLENIASSLANFVKYNHKNITNAISLTPQKHNDDNNKTVSTISPSDSIKNGPDSQYEVSTSHTLYTSLKEITALDDTPDSTPNFSPNFTNFMDPHFSVTSSKSTIFEPFSKSSETGFLQEEVITPSSGYVLKDSSEPSVNIFPSIKNATESLHEVNISAISYVNSTTSSELSEITSNLGLNFTKLLDPHFSVSCSKPTNFEPVSSIEKTAPLPYEEITPFLSYAFKYGRGPPSSSSVSGTGSDSPYNARTISDSASLYDGKN